MLQFYPDAYNCQLAELFHQLIPFLISLLLLSMLVLVWRLHITELIL